MTLPINHDLLTLTADIVAAHVSHNSVAVSDLPQLIRSVHGSLAGLGTPAVDAIVPQEPAVSVRSSVKPDYIICLEDGKKLKMLKRHLMSTYQMTPAQYRTKWNLPSDYPMVAPNYAATRKELALKIGLGRKREEVAADAVAPRVTGVANGLEAARKHLASESAVDEPEEAAAPAKKVPRKARVSRLVTAD